MKQEELSMGLTVKAIREFSGVPAGTKGEIVSASNSWPETDSVAVQWQRHPGDSLRDWFGFDELEFLEINL